jgi:hypothetical protein
LRENTRFSVKEAENFVKNAKELAKLEHVGKYILFVFSIGGFTASATDYLKNNCIASSRDKLWISRGIS